MNDSQKVAEAILDDKEWAEENLADPAAVQLYAENAMGIHLSDVEAYSVYLACHRWLRLVAQGSATAALYDRVVLGSLR